MQELATITLYRLELTSDSEVMLPEVTSTAPLPPTAHCTDRHAVAATAGPGARAASSSGWYHSVADDDRWTRLHGRLKRLWEQHGTGPVQCAMISVHRDFWADDLVHGDLS